MAKSGLQPVVTKRRPRTDPMVCFNCREWPVTFHVCDDCLRLIEVVGTLGIGIGALIVSILL
jgi:hypothetical protein